jgi:predicted ATPase/class 3 adenylate cyclase
MEGVAQPLGTVTLVFTDIEGSTRLLADLGQARYLDALLEHRRMVREAFGRYEGYEVDTEGDSFFYAFSSAAGAVRAVEEAMVLLEGGPITIRVGVHTGEPGLDGRNYVGMDVHTAARIMAAGHGGQVVLSQSTCELLDGSFVLRDLGEHRMKDLTGRRRLYQLGDRVFPPLRTLYRTNLPVPASSFVGRERELEELGALVGDDVRLVTLTGPGGSGKTRLALAVVAAAADAFPDGVWWVPLASVRDPGLVLSSVAVALGVPEQAGRGLQETLVDILSRGRTLLLLDNLEQLLPDAAASVAALRDAGGATVVVTSRERLQLAGEHVYAVAPLEATDAAELFTARAAALAGQGGSAEAVVELCERLDNLPLAVELAAARAGLLAPAEMLARLGGRLDRLQGGRDADPRQQTLRATIAWSHDLLDRSERELFARLAVFSGGATLDAVEVVCDGDLGVLASLLDKSLVRSSGGRVWMLETIREFASEQLDADPDADDLRDRHAHRYLALAEASDRELRGTGQVDALKRFASERDNLRAAFEWLLEHDSAAALRLAASLWNFWWMHGHFQEARELLAVALERADSQPTEARASVLVGAGLLAYFQDDYLQSFSLTREGLACARAAGSTMFEILALSNVADDTDLDPDERILLGEEAISLADASGDRWILGLVTGNHGYLMNQLGETGKAHELAEEAYRLCRAVGDTALTAIWANNLGWFALSAGDLVEARAKLDESLELAELIDDVREIGSATVNLGWVELLEGNLDLACTRFETGVALARHQGRRPLAAEAISGFAHIAAGRGDPERAARLAGAASALGVPAGYDPTTSVTFAHHLDEAQATLGNQAWQEARSDGAELDPDAALTLALNE